MKPLSKFLYLALFFTLSNFNFAQLKLVYMGSDNMVTNKRPFVAYDYLNNTFDTLLNFSTNQNYVNDYNTIDPYNGRYFFIGAHPSLGGFRLITIDLTTKAITYSQPLTIFNWGQITYDMYLNKLLFPYDNYIKTMDIATGAIDTLFQVPVTLADKSGPGAIETVYNMLQQKYLASVLNPPNNFFASIDIANQTLLDTTSTGSIYYDVNLLDAANNEYYSVSDDGIIIKIDPITCQKTTICQVPGFTSWMNREQAAFDSEKGLLILPYGDSNSQQRIAIVKASTGLIIRDSIKPNLDFARLYGRPRPSIKSKGQELTATFGTAYQWYLNDSIIAFATNQKYYPQTEGTYKVKVDFMNGRSEYSDPINFIFTGIKKNSTLQENILIYPNPVTDNLIISFSPTTPLDIGNISIFNSLGQTVFSEEIQIKNQSHSLQTNNLSKGIYQLHIKTSAGTISKQFVKN